MCSRLTYHLCQCIQLLALWFYSHFTALKIPEDEALDKSGEHKARTLNNPSIRRS
jgi:hypothetical protein